MYLSCLQNESTLSTCIVKMFMLKAMYTSNNKKVEIYASFEKKVLLYCSMHMGINNALHTPLLFLLSNFSEIFNFLIFNKLHELHVVEICLKNSITQGLGAGSKVDSGPLTFCMIFQFLTRYGIFLVFLSYHIYRYVLIKLKM